jgi:hypothetical protein
MFTVKTHQRDPHRGVIRLHAARINVLYDKSSEILIGLMRNR